MSKRFEMVKEIKNLEVKGVYSKGNYLCFDNGIPPWKIIVLLFLVGMFALTTHIVHSHPNDSEFVIKYIFNTNYLVMFIGSILMSDGKKENTLMQALKVIVSKWLK
ncbi:hypothetical protein AB8J25_002960 [Clostridium perfringens]